MHRDINANARRQQWRRTDDQDEQRNNFCGFIYVKEIPHHRHRRNLRRTPAQRLQEPERDEPLHCSRRKAKHRRRDE